MHKPGKDPLCSHLPLPLFASVMGLCGLGLVWHAIESRWGLAPVVSASATIVAAVVFVALLLGYLCKTIRNPDRVRKELIHPVRINFLPAISINLVLLGILSRDWTPALSEPLWMVGAGLQLLLTLVIVTVWLDTERPAASINPAWFIPAVGNVLIPVAAAPAGHHTIGWFFMTVGLFFWAMLITVVFYRLITKPPLEPAMRPTLAVMLAPPAVAFLAWLALNGEMNLFGQGLYFIALFTFLLLLGQIPGFLRLAWFPSWWAWTFPPAAFTVASFRYAEQAEIAIDPWLIGLAGLTTVIILLVALSTVIAIFRGELAKH
jgi:tellurite resistance protein